MHGTTTRTAPGPSLRWLRVGLVMAAGGVLAVIGNNFLPASAILQIFGTNTTAIKWTADGAVTEADGLLPEGITVFDDDQPGIANLQPELTHALRNAATAAADDGVEFGVHSAWRSPEYQDQLLQEAIARYGSRKKAARWVATVETSPHVSGDAVDLEPAARRWLAQHGASYGICQIYRNEPWHYELRRTAVHQGCPAKYANPTKNPRMRP